MAEVLTPTEVEAAVARQGLAWRLEHGVLEKVTKHGDFARALAYVNAVGALAEEANHHPDVDIRWDTVRLQLSTHSAGGITQADLKLAAAIDGLGPASG